MTTTTLGKRKSRTQKADPSVSQEDAMAIFRRHFEAQFKPLAPSDQSTKTAASAPEAEDMRSDSEDDTSNESWDGVSDEDGEDEEEEPGSSPPSSNAPTTAAEVEVVSHTPTPTTSLLIKLSKRETKAYLSSRPPPTTTSSTSTSSSTSKRKPAPTTADEDAPSLVKNDLALQRLLSESHLLASSSSSSSPAETEHAGRNRHLATDLRVAALGARSSIYAQAKMPMAVRKGIAAAAAGREAKRRREARENGIVLERPGSGGLGGMGKGKKGMGMSVGGGGGGGGGRRRERPVDAPAVGRLGGATLRLSKRDIAEIEAEGPRGRGGGAGKRRRR
ncbi:hypothetical protein F4809DRAFT_661485 [Biscogniauxia mediterranea]|nr:hypothetical protein F4809DRAFT_661485 [Biscogniauxia mediterranea]